MHYTSTNKQKYGLIQTTIWLIKTGFKGWHMNGLNNFYIQQYKLEGILIQ